MRFRKIQKYINNYLKEDTISVILINREQRQEIKNNKIYLFDNNPEPKRSVL